VQGQRRTSTNQSALAQLQDNERLAMTLITDTIQAAGYITDPTNTSLETALPVVAGFATAGQAIAGAAGAVAGDSLTVRYQTNGRDGVMSCIGTTSAVADTWVGTFDVDATGHLRCQPKAGAKAYPLVSGVTNFEVSYGVNTASADANSNCPADTYVKLTDMTATYWTNVCSVKVTITFTNPLRQPVAAIAPDTSQPEFITFTRVIAIMSKSGVNVVNFT
jgi:type IV pilus assembly protein PilW